MPKFKNPKFEDGYKFMEGTSHAESFDKLKKHFQNHEFMSHLRTHNNSAFSKDYHKEMIRARGRLIHHKHTHEIGKGIENPKKIRTF